MRAYVAGAEESGLGRSDAEEFDERRARNSDEKRILRVRRGAGQRSGN